MVKQIDKPEFIGQIIDIFEDFLEDRGIQLQNDERDEDPDAAIIYGTDYCELHSEIEAMMVAWGVL